MSLAQYSCGFTSGPDLTECGVSHRRLMEDTVAFMVEPRHLILTAYRFTDSFIAFWETSTISCVQEAPRHKVLLHTKLISELMID